MPPRNLATIAWNLGVHDVNRLRSVVRAWCQILDRSRPDLVVQDFGLISGLVARCLGIKTIRIGTGYTCPPRSETPIDLPWFTKRDENDGLANSGSASEPRGSATDVYIAAMKNIAVACRANGLPVPARWDEVVHGGPEDVLATLPLLDPYATVRRPSRWDGVWEGATATGEDRHADAAIRDCSSKSVLAYLKPFDHWREFFKALKELRVHVDLVADGVGDELLRQCDPDCVRLCSGFQSIPQAARRGMALINNGNHGSTALSLLHGMPVIACPLFFEQRLTAEAIDGAGIGTHLDVRFPDQFTTTLDEALFQKPCHARAKRFKRRHSKLFYDQIDRVLNRFVG
ncbi:glycosyltransferase [Allorhodopirellula solitaria]|uniref:glycosyltransferase n=1 Tax=Allorhodopirellula solitaria TaxID=2527987 RepID=UPI001C971932|nr:hypothetical protein [Allorhodopirellula solitaria]